MHPRPTVHHDDVEHLGARMHRDLAEADLARQRLVRAEQQLLPRLAARVERAGDLHAPEGAVREHPAVLPRERYALGHALVDDARADLGEAVHPCPSGPARARLYRSLKPRAYPP